MPNKTERKLDCIICKETLLCNDSYGKHLRERHGVCGDCSIGESEMCMEKCKERGLFKPQNQAETAEDPLDLESELRKCAKTMRKLTKYKGTPLLMDLAADKIKQLREQLERHGLK